MPFHIVARAGVLVLTGCAMVSCGTPISSPADLNQSYERALVRTAPMAATLTPGSVPEQHVFDNLQRYFDGMTSASVREQTAQVYAPLAYLNDTMVAIEGAGNIQTYFSHTLESASLLRVEFLDRAASGTDWYVRWRMTTVADALNGGIPVVTYGVSQFRFDAEGRVLIHKDFWDSGTGIYEQIPVLRSIVGRVRAAIGAAASGVHPDNSPAGDSSQ